MKNFLKKHKSDLYNILLTLSRNIFFYKRVGLSDKFETRIYLMFIHFSIFLIISKKKEIKFNQKEYDYLFNYIEYDLRELGFGDVAVNKKMKDLNKIFYDILLKLDLTKNDDKKISINEDLLNKYFTSLKDAKNINLVYLNDYFSGFFYYCFDLTFDKMVEESINFKY